MNTEIEQKDSPPPPDVFDLPSGGNEYDTNKLISKICQLEDNLSESKDSHKAERFYWIVGTTFLFDIIIMKFLEDTSGFVILVVLELFVLGALAKRLGVDWAVEAIDSSLQWISGHFKRS